MQTFGANPPSVSALNAAEHGIDDDVSARLSSSSLQSMAINILVQILTALSSEALFFAQAMRLERSSAGSGDGDWLQQVSVCLRSPLTRTACGTGPTTSRVPDDIPGFS